MQKTGLMLLLLLGLTSGAIASLPPPPEPETATATTFYAQNGSGLFGLAGRANTSVTFASIAIEAGSKVDISVRLGDGRLMSFGGTLTGGDAYTLTIDLNSSGMADASGVMTVRYGANQSIVNLTANGELDGQPFFITFRGRSQP